MTGAEKKPMPDDEIAPPKPKWEPSGRSRHADLPSAKAVPMHWPTDWRGRHEAADTWGIVAAQIAQTKSHFRVLLALSKSIRRDTGTTADGNETLAAWTGGMDATDVSKAVSFFAKVGLLVVEIGFLPGPDGKVRKGRKVRLAMPDPFPAGVSIELPNQRSTSNQVGARPQDQFAESSWVRVPADGTRTQISLSASSDKKQGTAMDAGTKAVDVAIHVKPGSAAQTVNDGRERTAAPSQGAASIESPASSADTNTEIQ
ncbi:hypothetical protein [Mesorhizobium cantuariense]|uniref:Uncharacterized protein n=1 Tax=Mesorhizobium cantuariense TaxID=1300275 RepID=A0ABV7MPY1_9HYPH